MQSNHCLDAADVTATIFGVAREPAHDELKNGEGPMATPEDVRQIALMMADVAERSSYGTPAFYLRRKLFARLLEDGDSVVVKIDYHDRERRMEADPNTFIITDHYRNYPMVIVRLSAIDTIDLRELLDAARQYVGG